MNDVNFRAEIEQATRGFEAKQTAANDGGALFSLRVIRNRFAIIQRSKHKHALLEFALFIAQPFNRRHKRRTASRNDQVVIRFNRAVCPRHQFQFTINAGDAHPRVQLDVVFFVPGQRIDEDVLRIVGAGQDA